MTPKKNLIPVFEQQTPIEFTNKQLHIFWLPEEIKVEKDVQDVLVNFTPAEADPAHISAVHQEAFNDPNILALYYITSAAGVTGAKPEAECIACQ